MSALATASAPNTGVNVVALTVLIVLFLAVTVMGFLATRWRQAESMESLDEWGLGGRGFGTWVTWFLLGGDLYTAYTFIAVPAAMFALGSVSGFFAVPYTIVVYPIIFVFMSRLWSVSHRHGYVTAADFVRGRYGSRGLSLAVAVTGILATMPYIALQLVGIEAVLEVIGLGGNSALARDLPLFIAFAVLAAYTYSSGLRAPALIAFVKDALIYLVIIVAVIYLPAKYGGWGHIFDSAQTKMAKTNPATGKPGAFIPGPTQYWAYGTLALGSALALFMYPHSVTAVLSSKSRTTIRRNAAILPAYSFVLGLLALLGWVAIAAGTKPIGLNGQPNAQLVIPQLFEDSFPSWFAGVAFAAVAIGALVPAAIMSIAAANLFTRNIYREWLRPNATVAQEAKVGKLVSLLVKFVALDLRPDDGQAERHQLPAARRDLDPADAPVRGVRALHPLVPPVGAAGRLGRRDGLRHAQGLQRELADGAALRRLAGPDGADRAAGLHRVHGVRHQHHRGGGPHADPAGAEVARGRGQDGHGRLLRRRRRPAGQAAAGADHRPALTDESGPRLLRPRRAGPHRTCPPRRPGACVAAAADADGPAGARSAGAAQHAGQGVDHPGVVLVPEAEVDPLHRGQPA